MFQFRATLHLNFPGLRPCLFIFYLHTFSIFFQTRSVIILCLLTVHSPYIAPFGAVPGMQLGVQTTQAYRCSAEDYETMIRVQNELNSEYSSEIITEYAFNGAGILQEVSTSIMAARIFASRSAPPFSHAFEE